MINPEHYTYRVIWSEEDNEFVGLCAEFLVFRGWRKANTAR
ncbi:MAG: hypothetical protein R2867_20915 [Caldilineaceae bacterium]